MPQKTIVLLPYVIQQFETLLDYMSEWDFVTGSQQSWELLTAAVTVKSDVTFHSLAAVQQSRCGGDIVC